MWTVTINMNAKLKNMKLILYLHALFSVLLLLNDAKALRLAAPHVTAASLAARGIGPSIEEMVAMGLASRISSSRTATTSAMMQAMRPSRSISSLPHNGRYVSPTQTFRKSQSGRTSPAPRTISPPPVHANSGDSQIISLNYDASNIYHTTGRLVSPLAISSLQISSGHHSPYHSPNGSPRMPRSPGASYDQTRDKSPLTLADKLGSQLVFSDKPDLSHRRPGGGRSVVTSTPSTGASGVTSFGASCSDSSPRTARGGAADTDASFTSGIDTGGSSGSRASISPPPGRIKSHFWSRGRRAGRDRGPAKQRPKSDENDPAEFEWRDSGSDRSRDSSATPPSPRARHFESSSGRNSPLEPPPPLEDFSSSVRPSRPSVVPKKRPAASRSCSPVQVIARTIPRVEIRKQNTPPGRPVEAYAVERITRRAIKAFVPTNDKVEKYFFGSHNGKNQSKA